MFWLICSLGRFRCPRSCLIRAWPHCKYGVSAMTVARFSIFSSVVWDGWRYIVFYKKMKPLQKRLIWLALKTGRIVYRRCGGRIDLWQDKPTQNNQLAVEKWEPFPKEEHVKSASGPLLKVCFAEIISMHSNATYRHWRPSITKTLHKSVERTFLCFPLAMLEWITKANGS